VESTNLFGLIAQSLGCDTDWFQSLMQLVNDPGMITVAGDSPNKNGNEVKKMTIPFSRDRKAGMTTYLH